MPTKAFIDREAFGKLIADVPTEKGGAYQDVNTIYRDMSRLVVTWLAKTPTQDLRRIYNQGGWEGNPYVRALSECAKAWLEQHHPEFLR